MDGWKCQYEIDNVEETHLPVLYRIIRALAVPLTSDEQMSQPSSRRTTWEQFIEDTYGSLADDPIERGMPSNYEKRESIR